jgi:membrane glycosyltransferase
MKLSDSEMRFVKKWQRHQHSWRWVRWFLAVFCVICIVVTAWNLQALLNLTGGSSGDSAAIGWFAPFVWFTLIASSGLLGYTIGHWRGDIKTALLLRLIDEHENSGVSEGRHR